MKNLSSELADTLLRNEVAEEVVGCSSEEIKKLEEDFSVRLPAVYKEFLAVMGKDAGDFENDAFWSLDALKEARERATWILRKAGSGDAGAQLSAPFALKQTDFVFLCGDYNFLYFDTTAGDDPPVVVVEESDKRPGLTVPSFNDWLTLTINRYGEIFEGVQ